MTGSRKTSLWVGAAILAVLIPATLYVCYIMGNRRYYLASILMIGYTMIPLVLAFERRRVQARELVTLAVLCALAVVSRAAFIWLPHFKPICAVIMICGIAFGAESGFIVGAVSAFVSNFLFGQGAWTPWQMYAFGLCGFVAGLPPLRTALRRNKYIAAVVGYMLIVLLVGPLLDTCALFTMSSEINPASAGAVYLSGLPVNLVHAVAVALTMLLLSQPMLEKLERIKLKYGILENQI